MHNDLVSIIMPMHNSASYVGEAITSVLKQTYPHWELLVIEDASKDNSCEYISRARLENSPAHQRSSYGAPFLAPQHGREAC